ncbi:MAG TPA: hypothetical protein PKG90_06480 [Chitinophagaceae bacterium]|nr:hypothetical protein [Chitinophagaceae bacterium]HNU13316.1 hypothetical protein [Chitinophagaceae bacterium]
MNLQNKNILGVAGIAATLFLASCTKTFDEKVEQQRNFSNSSILQVYMGTVSATRNYVYVDSKPVNGAAIALGGVFPATGYGFSVPIGVRAFLIRDTLTAATQTPLSFAENMQPNKNYTIFMYDTINAAKQKTVETNIVIPDDTTARLRFANFVFSKTTVPAVDIFSKRRNQNIFTNIQVTDVTGFIPYASALTDTFLVRETGTMNQLAALNGLTPTARRSYTLVFRGRYGTTSGTIARTLSSFVNF